MARRRSASIAAPLALLLGACATVTPEQAARRSLLSDAAQDCLRRHPFVVRFEFDRFDVLHWTYREGATQAERGAFRTCYTAQVTERTKAAAAARPQSPPTSAASVGADAAPRPDWAVGQEWVKSWTVSPRT